jgi:hypothetical protein
MGWPDVKHIFSAERLPFSLAYFGSLGLTLFFAIGVSDSPLPTCILETDNWIFADSFDNRDDRGSNSTGEPDPHKAADFAHTALGGRIVVLCRGVLPWWNYDVAFRWSDGPQGRWKFVTHIMHVSLGPREEELIMEEPSVKENVAKSHTDITSLLSETLLRPSVLRSLFWVRVWLPLEAVLRTRRRLGVRV